MAKVGWLDVVRIRRGQDEKLDFAGVAGDVGADPRIDQQRDAVDRRVQCADCLFAVACSCIVERLTGTSSP